ncbi:shikimate kinase [Bacillus sp. 1P06AnD]|uniref:shikimate kinase n=1 Tax=Bacillus sp. 1P06AnD TaxID=3132208 RepID=UPI0039A145F2
MVRKMKAVKKVRTIYLTGFMGSGKTTIGHMAAKAFNLIPYDVDALIVEKEGIEINQLFAEKGEAYFREQEKQLLRSLPIQNAIVMTGGGIILDNENRAWMKENGQLIYLYCEIEEVYRRLKNDTTRPLANGRTEEELRSLFEDRRELYEDASIQIDVTEAKPEEVIELLRERIDPS